MVWCKVAETEDRSKASVSTDEAPAPRGCLRIPRTAAQAVDAVRLTEDAAWQAGVFTTTLLEITLAYAPLLDRAQQQDCIAIQVLNGTMQFGREEMGLGSAGCLSGAYIGACFSSLPGMAAALVS